MLFEFFSQKRWASISLDQNLIESGGIAGIFDNLTKVQPGPLASSPNSQPIPQGVLACLPIFIPVADVDDLIGQLPNIGKVFVSP